jgi:hypothetical protein
LDAASTAATGARGAGGAAGDAGESGWKAEGTSGPLQADAKSRTKMASVVFMDRLQVSDS